MYVRDKSIIVGLALLVGSYACAQEAVNRLQKSYQSSKQQFKQNQTADLFNTLNGQLDNIEAAIASSGMSSRWRSDKNNWVQQERAWLAGIMPAPAAPAQVPLPEAVPVLALPTKYTAAAPGTQLKNQADQANKLVADFDTAVANKNLNTMNAIYQQMLTIFPQLNLIDEKGKQETLAETKKAMNAMAINGLFDYIAQRKDTPIPRRAESALIRILNEAPKNPAIRQQQDELIALIYKNGLYSAPYATLISPRMMIRDDKPRTEPITADDRTIKTSN